MGFLRNQNVSLWFINSYGVEGKFNLEGSDSFTFSIAFFYSGLKFKKPLETCILKNNYLTFKSPFSSLCS